MLNGKMWKRLLINYLKYTLRFTITKAICHKFIVKCQKLDNWTTLNDLGKTNVPMWNGCKCVCQSIGILFNQINQSLISHWKTIYYANKNVVIWHRQSAIFITHETCVLWGKKNCKRKKKWWSFTKLRHWINNSGIKCCMK